MAKRGRPPFAPTEAQRRHVSIAAGAGMDHGEIALAIGVSHVTLSKYFAHELTVGACQRRMEVLVAVHKQAKRGNVAAAKAYGQLAPRPGAAGTSVDGKKAQAQVAAGTAQQGTEWESLLTPPTSVQ